MSVKVSMLLEQIKKLETELLELNREHNNLSARHVRERARFKLLIKLFGREYGWRK